LGQKKNDPHQRLESLERWSRRAKLWILLGIVIELGALIWFSHGWWERLWGITANVLIGVGLAAEYVVIGRAIIAGREAQQESDERVATAEARGAEANAKARAAELQLERLKHPRMPDQAKFAKELEGASAGTVEILYAKECSDCFFCAGWICAWFEGSGWKLTRFEPLISSSDMWFDAFSTMSVGADPWGVSVIAKNPVATISAAPADRSPWMAAFLAVKSSLEPYASVNGKGDPKMPDGLVRVVVAPRP
jgi:hypothetical protein